MSTTCGRWASDDGARCPTRTNLERERFERVHLDTTMVFTPFFEEMAAYPRDLLPRLRELGLAGKVLLGSDFPNVPYPYAEQLASLARLDLGEDWLRDVCWHNPASLLGVDATG